MNWGECYYDHFERHLGSPASSRAFSQGDKAPSIQILTYERVFENIRTFCSLGLSHYAAEIKTVAEVFLPVTQGWDEVPHVLANVLFYMVQHRIVLGLGTYISGIGHIDPTLAEVYQKSALYFTHPYGVPDEFNQVECNGAPGHVYLAFFISTAEQAFVRSHGWEQFEAHLEALAVDPLELQRSSCV